MSAQYLQKEWMENNFRLVSPYSPWTIRFSQRKMKKKRRKHSPWRHCLASERDSVNPSLCSSSFIKVFFESVFIYHGFRIWKLIKIKFLLTLNWQYFHKQYTSLSVFKIQSKELYFVLSSLNNFLRSHLEFSNNPFWLFILSLPLTIK